MTALTCTDLTVMRGPCPVVDRVSLTVAPGEVVGLIGPNGAGKTTLMRAALGLLPHRGQSSLAALTPAARARAAAWLPQAREIAWGISVEALVGLGRVPHADGAADDARAVAAALARTDLTAFADRPATALSGGEQARVLLARALAQEAPLLIADEPIGGLDPAHQIATMQAFRDLAAEARGVLVSLHDLGLAARFCDRLVLLQAGRKVAEGPPAAVLDADRLANVFGILAWRAETPFGPVIQPVGLAD